MMNQGGIMHHCQPLKTTIYQLLSTAINSQLPLVHAYVNRHPQKRPGRIKDPKRNRQLSTKIDRFGFRFSKPRVVTRNLQKSPVASKET